MGSGSRESEAETSCFCTTVACAFLWVQRYTRID